MSCERHAALRARARDLRREGRSLAQIAGALGIRPDNSSLKRWLRDLPRPAWTRRPTARDALRIRARELRRQGLSYAQIAERTGAARGTLSSWLHDIQLEPEQRKKLRRASREGQRRGGETVRRRARARRRAITEAARAEITSVGPRELFIAGIIAYWAEGTKLKPWGRGPRVVFVNSDPTMVAFFLHWLGQVGVRRDDLILRLMIHESGDEVAALRFWSYVTAVPVEAFRKTSFKRHRPMSRRGNTGENYVGCLTISVRSSSELYYKIEGWYQGLMEALGCGVPRRAHETLTLEDQVRFLAAQPHDGSADEEAIPYLVGDTA